MSCGGGVRWPLPEAMGDVGGAGRRRHGLHRQGNVPTTVDLSNAGVETSGRGGAAEREDTSSASARSTATGGGGPCSSGSSARRPKRASRPSATDADQSSWCAASYVTYAGTLSAAPLFSTPWFSSFSSSGPSDAVAYGGQGGYAIGGGGGGWYGGGGAAAFQPPAAAAAGWNSPTASSSAGSAEDAARPEALSRIIDRGDWSDEDDETYGVFDEQLQDAVYLGRLSPYNDQTLKVKNGFLHFDVGFSSSDSYTQAKKHWQSAPARILHGSWHTKYPWMEVAHTRKECKPCAYFLHKKDGCRLAEKCEFCHLCSRGEIKRRKKAKLKIIREQEQAAARTGKMRSR